MLLEVIVACLVALFGGIVPAIDREKGMIFPTLKTEVPLNLQEVPIKLQVATFLKTYQPIMARCNANREGNRRRSLKVNQPARDTPKL
jgi:hypothetical protein